MFYDNSATRFQTDVETSVIGHANVSATFKTNALDSYSANHALQIQWNYLLWYDFSVTQLQFEADLFTANGISCSNPTEMPDKRLKENVEDVETVS